MPYTKDIKLLVQPIFKENLSCKICDHNQKPAHTTVAT